MVLSRIAVLRTRPIVINAVALSVCRSVCLSVRIVSSATTAEPTEMPLGCGLGWAQGTCIIYYRWRSTPDIPMGRGNFEGVVAADCGGHAVFCQIILTTGCFCYSYRGRAYNSVWRRSAAFESSAS